MYSFALSVAGFSAYCVGVGKIKYFSKLEFLGIHSLAGSGWVEILRF